MVYEKGRVGGRWQIVLEGLEDPVSYPCLWNSKRVLGRLNRRGVRNGEFRHGLRLLLGRALDKFAVAHDGLLCIASSFEQEDTPSVQNLSVNF